jgi:hypothetical protein
LNSTTQLANSVAIAKSKSDLVDFPAGLSGANHFLGFPNVKSERLLAENMLPMLQRRLGLARVKRISRDNGYRINIVS